MTTEKKLQEKMSNFKNSILEGFEKKVKGDKSLNTGLLLIHSPSLGIHWKTAAHHNSLIAVDEDQAFHFASIGKTVTSVMIGILVEKGVLSFEDCIAKYLDSDVLLGLHVFKGVDYSNELRIKQLLNHTSGLPDYYMDRNKKKVRLIDRMIAETDRFWTAIETINWAKEELTPKFKPGNGFHYSDTNYQLLGLIIEKVTGMSLHDALHRYIFEALGMNHTFQIFYSEPKEKDALPMVDLWHGEKNLSKAKSISMSWASGGIVSTTEDMLKFHKSIVENRIIRKETFGKMCDFAKMGPSFYYGYGIMNFRFMFMPKKYDIWGNSGSIGAFMYYNAAMDLYLIGCFHKVNYQVQPIFYLFGVLRKFNKAIKSGILRKD